MLYSEPDDIRQIEILKRMSGEDRMRVGFEIYEFARKLAIAGIRYRFPDITEAELKEKLKERYQWQPSKR